MAEDKTNHTTPGSGTTGASSLPQSPSGGSDAGSPHGDVTDDHPSQAPGAPTAQAMAEAAMRDVEAAAKSLHAQATQATPPPPVPGSTMSLQRLDNVDMDVTVELGRTRMTIEEILRLGEHSVIELDREAGGPVDLFVNGCQVAKGEVMVLNDNFCVKVTEIIEANLGTDVGG